MDEIIINGLIFFVLAVLYPPLRWLVYVIRKNRATKEHEAFLRKMETRKMYEMLKEKNNAEQGLERQQ